MIHDIPDESPETVYETFEVDVQAGHVKKGDVISTMEVATNKVGTKWSEIRSTDGDKLIFRITNETPVTVTRRRETKESRATSRRHDSNRRIRKELESLAGKENPAMARAKVISEQEYNFVDYSDIGVMLSGQARWRIEVQFRQAFEYTRDQPAEDWNGDYVEFLSEFKDSLLNRLLEKTRSAANRSTNQVSNLMDDLEIEALSTFIDNTKWWMY